MVVGYLLGAIQMSTLDQLHYLALSLKVVDSREDLLKTLILASLSPFSMLEQLLIAVRISNLVHFTEATVLVLG